MLKEIKIYFLIFLSLGLTACQAGNNFVSQSNVGGKIYDPCQLLTAQDVEGIFSGLAITVTKHDLEPNAIGQKICFYSADETDMKFVQISVINEKEMLASTQAGGQNAEQLFSNTKDMIEGSQEINGLGDAAFFGGNGLKLGSGLHVLKKDKGIYFSLDLGLGRGNIDEAKHIELETNLAKKVLNRL
jgi:hypothetical protein